MRPPASALLVIPLLGVSGLVMLWGSALVASESRAAPREIPAPLTHVGLAMPLSTGASAMRPFGTPMIVLHVVAFGPLFVAPLLPGWTTLVLGVLVAAWFLIMVSVTVEAWTRRASDLLLGDEGLEIRGGPLGGVRQDWAQLGAPPARWERAEDAFHSTLWIADEVVAVSEDEAEHRSLECIALTVRGLTEQALGLDTPSPPSQIDDTPSYRSCGCPTAPSAAPTTACARCGEDVEISEAVRRQFAASQILKDARRETEALLERLLRQPGARVTNGLMILAIPPLLLGLPAASVLFDELSNQRGVVPWQQGPIVFVGALAFSYGLFGLLRSQIGGRQALRLIAGDFAGRPPRSEGEPWFCRQCAAPLPRPDGAVAVSACVYCDAESIIGLDLVPSAQTEARQTLGLREELQGRLQLRRRQRMLSVASLGVIGASLALSWPMWKELLS